MFNDRKRWFCSIFMSGEKKKVFSISRDEALKSAEDLVLAPDYEKMNNTKNTRTYVVVDLIEKKPRFCKKSNGFVFLKK